MDDPLTKIAVDRGLEMTASAVVVAAGRGERLGVAAKCFLPLRGKPMLAYVLDAVDVAKTVRDTVLVVGEHTFGAAEELLGSGGWVKPVRIVIGGAERQESVANGVMATGSESDVVVIHDAARPMVEAVLFDRCVRAAAETGAAIGAAPVADTIKQVEHGRVVRTVPRDDLWAAQTPQAFRRDLLVAALASEAARSRRFTDEAGLFETLGMEVTIVPGDRANIKVTHPADVALAEAILAERSRVRS